MNRDEIEVAPGKDTRTSGETDRLGVGGLQPLTPPPWMATEVEEATVPVACVEGATARACVLASVRRQCRGLRPASVSTLWWAYRRHPPAVAGQAH